MERVRGFEVVSEKHRTAKDIFTDEKKKKHLKALKKAKKSAKDARYASQMSRKQVMMLAKVSSE